MFSVFIDQINVIGHASSQDFFRRKSRFTLVSEFLFKKLDENILNQKFDNSANYEKVVDGAVIGKLTVRACDTNGAVANHLYRK